MRWDGIKTKSKRGKILGASCTLSWRANNIVAGGEDCPTSCTRAGYAEKA